VRGDNVFVIGELKIRDPGGTDPVLE